MPASTQAIDWPGIRAASVAIGIRGAARRAAADLPADEQRRFVERVMKRASREGWQEAKAAVSASSAIMPAQAKPMSANVRSGADTLESELETLGRESKLAMAKGLRTAARHVEQLDGEELLEKADKVKATAGSLSLVHSWEAKAAPSGPASIVNVAILLDGCPLPGKDTETMAGNGQEPIDV